MFLLSYLLFCFVVLGSGISVSVYALSKVAESNEHIRRHFQAEAHLIANASDARSAALYVEGALSDPAPPRPNRSRFQQVGSSSLDHQRITL